MKHLEDKRSCPHCGGELHRQPYLMSRAAEANVLSTQLVAWIAVAAMALLVLTAR